MLADQGLTAALQAQVGKAPLPVLIEADGIGRYPRDTEAAVYFCILEALQNVAKYSRASRATVALSCPDSHLEFSIIDDGAGFDTAKATLGTGLQGMAGRLAAVGGTLRVLSQPGHGTIVSGTLPAAQLAEPGANCPGCSATVSFVVSLVHHLVVGGRVAADAPEVPPGHRLFSLRRL